MDAIRKRSVNSTGHGRPSICEKKRQERLNTSSGLVHCSLGRSWCAIEHCIIPHHQNLISTRHSRNQDHHRHRRRRRPLNELFPRSRSKGFDWTDLEGSSDSKDSVIGFLGRETLQGLLNGFGLFGDEIIRPLCFPPPRRFPVST